MVAFIGDFNGDFRGDFNGDFITDFTADFRDERITERIMDFSADAPFLLCKTLFTISFSFLSFILSSDAMLNAMSAFLAMGSYSFFNGLGGGFARIEFVTRRRVEQRFRQQT